MIKVNDMVRFSTEDQGRIASSKVKTFEGRVASVGLPFQTPRGDEIISVKVAVAPNFKSFRFVTIGRDHIEVIG